MTDATAATATTDAPAPAPRTSKAAIITKLLTRSKGATVPEMREATGWQPHSVRAFLSGLRKKGYSLSKEQRKSGEIAYRLTRAAAAAVEAASE